MNNPYPAAYPQQPQSAYQQPSYQQRPAPLQTNDAANGLAHQLSHQNLGGAARTNAYGGRQGASSRPRTAGTPNQQTGYASYLNAPMPSPAAQQQQSWPEFQIAPERNNDKYGSLTITNQKKCSQLAESFFKDSVKRARDRNVR